MIITCLLFLLCIYNSIRPDDRILSDRRDTTTIVKYLTAVMVVIGHLFIAPETKALGGEIRSRIAYEFIPGMACVALFLFFSGYGLVCAYIKKGDSYLKGFLRKRLMRIIVPWITAILVSLILCQTRNLGYEWYCYAIIVLYIIFFIVFKYWPMVSDKHRTCDTDRKIWALSSIVMIVMIALTLLSIKVNWFLVQWSISLHGFVMGVLYARYEVPIRSFVRKYALIVLPCTMVIFASTLRCYDFNELMVSLNPALVILSDWKIILVYCVFMQAAFILFSVYYIDNSKLSCNIQSMPFLSSFYEIYVIQKVPMRLLTSYIEDPWLYCGSVILLTLVMAYPLYRLNTYICNQIGKIKFGKN